jgi:hypothetical protein
VKSLGYTGVLIVFLCASYGFAQGNIDAAIGVRVDTKMTPYRVFWLFPPSANNLEINFSIDGQTTPFSALMFKCDFLGEGGQRTGGVSSSMSKSEFKPSANGRLVAQRLIEHIVPANVTSATCRVVDVTK